jgi:hypothetical protein
MGRPRTAKHPESVAPAPLVQPIAATSKLESPVANDNKPIISKAEAVRQAVAEGLSSPSEIADYAKTRFGLDIPKPQVSAYKAQGKAKATATTPKATPGRKPRVVVDGHVAPAPKIVPTGEGDLLEALKSLKGLVSAHGTDKVKSMVDLLS